MKEVKRTAKKGDKIKVITEGSLDWGRIVYPVDSIWIVNDLVFEESGLVLCEGNDYGIYAKDYVVIE